MQNKFHAITLHILKKRPFAELLDDSTLVYTTSTPIHATLETNLLRTIGNLKGSFKTAHWGRLTPGSAGVSIDDLARFPWKAPVCIKQTYYLKSKGPGYSRKSFRHDPTKEMQLLLAELRCQAWGEGLMGLVYDFVDREVCTRGAPPFEVPQMRFVESALMVQQHDGGHVLLAEELITQEEEGGFRKYLDNAHATPFEDLGPADLYRAQFLCFAQHVQWEKTQGKAFISDFQGEKTCSELEY